MVLIEGEIERAILAQKRWADLDVRMRELISSSQEYDKKILRYSIENQLRYRGNLVRFVINDEREYYEQLLKYSRDHLMLFPYHLSDFIIAGMRRTPFRYYLSIMVKILEEGKSYDTLPNFTAADCLRLLGIGRNQYIDIMNELRSTHRKFLGIEVGRDAESLLPNKPEKTVPIEPWWFVNAGYITEDDVRSMVTISERSVIDRLVAPDGLTNQILACDLDEALVRSLHSKGLIFLDVPIYDDDYIVVPPLEGFVMNRVTGDYFETLLYKIFVSIDQNTTVQELAGILEIDIRLVKNAVSMYCRLNFAYKKNIYIDIDKCHPSWRGKLEDYKKTGINVAPQTTASKSRLVSDFMNELALAEDNDHGTEVVDNSNSITLEDSLNNQTQQHLGKDVEARSVIQLPSNNLLSPTGQNQSTAKKIALFYDSNLAAFLMMGNLSSKLKNHAVTMFEVGKLSDEWIDSLLDELSNIKGDAIEEDGYEAKRYYNHAIMLHRTIVFIRTDLRLASDLLQSDTNDSNLQKADSRVGLDLIRIESLSNLDTESCQRFLKKNYQLIISVAPLNSDVNLNSASSLPHLGPGSSLINSLWFRIYLYSITGHGPPSLLLLQGYRLGHIPKIFETYNTLLINHWNREPTCVPISNALSAINDALTHSPVLVQGYPMQPIGGNLVDGEEKVFVPLPLVFTRTKNQEVEEELSGPKHTLEDPKEFPSDINDLERLENTPAIVKLSECLNLTKMCGYVTLLKSSDAVKDLVASNEGATDLFARTKRKTSCESSQMNLHPTCANVNPVESSCAKSGSEKAVDDPTNENLAASRRSDALENLTLFDCHFGVPLFDRFLNKQVRSRISSENLCDPNSLSQIVRANGELDEKLGKFIEKYSSSKELESIDTSNSGDQRHFFYFPDTDQFRCLVPRPAQNLVFAEGILSVLGDNFD